MAWLDPRRNAAAGVIPLVHWINHILGADYGLPYGHWGFYNVESGSGSDLSELAIVAGLVAAVRRWNCEVHGCWRLGRHKTAAGHAVCRVHHPDGHLSAEQVKELHDAAKRA